MSIQELPPPTEPQYVASDGSTVVFPVNLTGVDFTTVREILKAPARARHSLYLMGVLITNPTATATTVWLQRSTASSPVTISPIFQVPAYTNLTIVFPHMIKVLAGKNVGAKSTSSSTSIEVWIFGRY
jgi:hypothetical protein